MDLAATSTEFVHADVAATADGDPVTLSDPPMVAFISGSANPTPADWHAAEWDGGTARIMVGPEGGELTLATGSYWMWIKWTAGQETPVHRAGRVRIY